MVVLAVALVFDSMWGAAQVFLSLPLAIGGVVAAFWLLKAAFTREAAVGVILVIGLAVNQAILLADAALEKRRALHAAGLDARLHAGQVLHAALDRAGMILIVTLAAMASLIPLSVGTDATRLFGAIALATAGGTVAGTLGVLFVMPALLVGRRVPRTRAVVPAAAS
jgi:HAE1 family hydrophobic/amphiphilic exporter-1